MPEDIFDTLDSPSQDIFDEVYQTGGFGEMPPEIGAGPAEIYRGEEYVPTGPRIDLSTWSPTTSFLPSYGVNVPPAITPSAPLEQPFLLPAPDTRGILERAAAAITPSPETTQAAFDVMATLGPSMPNVPGVAMPSPAFDPALAQRILESPTVPGEAAKATSAVLELLNQQTLDPANIALMAGPAALAKLRVAPEAINIGNRILQAALSGRALAETPEAVSGTAEAIARGAPPSEYVPLGAQAALGLAMGYAGGKGALQGPITLRELTRRTEVPRRTEPAAKPVVEPKVSPSEQAASPAGREMNTFDGGGQIEVLRVEGDKAIVRDLATGQERESKGEIFQTPKRPISEEPASVAERAEVQRQVDELPNNKHIQDALRFNEENGLVTQIRFSDTLNTGLKIKPDSIAVTDTDGTIVINPRAFLDWIKDRTTAKTEEGLRKAIRGVISEEGIHGVIWRLVNQGLISEAEIRALWDNASALQKGFTNLSYTGKWSGRGHNSWQMGHELFRREFQRLMELKPREVEQLRGSERFKAEMLDLAERAIIGLEKVIRPNKELAALIKRTKENIDLAREAVEPPEGSPFPRSLKEEEVLPGITAAEFRPEAPEYVREAEEYSRMPSSDFAVQMRKLPGGVTGQAFEMGKRLKTEEDVLDLIRMRNEIYAKADEVKQQFLKTKDMELLNKGMEIGTQGQYFNEAIQFATGFPESKQEIYRKWGHADYKPSVSISKERFAQLEAEAKQPALVSAEFRPTERATEEDRIWSRLEAASGAELDRMIASMNLKAKMGADYEKGTIPDSTAADVPASQRNLRARAMARIGEKMIAETEREIQPLDRKTVTASEVGWDRESERNGPAYFEVGPELQSSPDIGKQLTKGAMVKGQKQSVTRRVTFLRDNETGEVHGVSTFMAGDVPRIRDPESRKAKHVHADLSELLSRKTAEGTPRYTVESSVLLDDPVQEFHHRYANEAEFLQDIGRELSGRNLEVSAEPEVQGEMGTMAGAEGQRIPLPERPSIPTGEAPLTDAELHSIWQHFASEEPPSLAAVQNQFDALRVESRGAIRPTARTMQIASGLDKIFQQIRRSNPDLSPEQAMERTLSWIYENTGKEATRSQFVEKALGEFARRSAEVGAAHEAVPAPEPAAAPTATAASGPVVSEPPAAFNWRSVKQLEETVAKAERTRRAFGTLFSARSNRKIMDQTFDAASNMANISGRQAGRHVNIGINDAQDKAASVVIASGFDPTNLPELMDMAIRGEHAEAQAAIRLAMNRWNDIVPIARRGKEMLDAEINTENGKGIDVDYHEDYLPGIYDMDLLMGAGRPFVISGRGTGISTGFKKGKTYDTPFHAIADGYKPKSLKLSDLVEHRVKVGQRLINKKAWADGLRTINDPTDNRPIVTKLIRDYKPGTREYTEKAPMGYVTREIIPGVRVAIHEGYTSLFDALTGSSRISGSIPGRIALGVAGGIKHGLLAFDTFHASRIMQKELFLTGKIRYAKGKSILEYADRDLTRAVDAKEITQEMADWVRANRASAELLLKSGLNVGRIQEAMYADVIRNVPVIGTFNKWVFEKVTRGAMMESALIEFERVSKARPDLSPSDVARKVSRDLNVYFGNLGHQGFFKSATMQDIARLVTLAPNWVESMARTEVLGTLQGVKGLTYDPIVHRNILVGTVGKGVAQGLLAYVIGTQLLNLVTRGKPTWENEEEGHKFDAWIPDIRGKGNGFFISPLSVVAELTHDMIRYSHTEKNSLDAAMRIASNKASPLWRAGKVLMMGTDYNQTQINSAWDRIKAAAWALAPTPIPLSPVIKGTDYPGQLQRQLTASAGFKTEPAPGAQQQIRTKAQRFVESNRPPKEVEFRYTAESPYRELYTALRMDNPDRIQAAIKTLRKTRKDADIEQAMKNRAKHPFTGSTTLEDRFKRTLSPAERQTYMRAVSEKKQEYSRFMQQWANRDRRAE